MWARNLRRFKNRPRHSDVYPTRHDSGQRDLKRLGYLFYEPTEPVLLFINKITSCTQNVPGWISGCLRACDTRHHISNFLATMDESKQTVEHIQHARSSTSEEKNPKSGRGLEEGHQLGHINTVQNEVHIQPLRCLLNYATQSDLAG